MAAWDETCTKDETGCTFRMRALCLSGSNWQNVRQCCERDDKAAEQYKGRHMADTAEHIACVKPMGSKALAALSGVGIGSALSLALCMTRRLDSSLGSIGIAESTAAVYGFLAGMAIACGVVLALHARTASKRSSGILLARHGRGLACLLCLICLMALLGLFAAPALLASVCSALLGACTALSGIWWFSRASVLGINQLIHASCLAVALAGLTQALFKTVPSAGSYALMACLCLFETLGLAIQANQISQNADYPKSTINRMDLAEAMGGFKAQALLEDSSRPARVHDILALSWIAVASLAFSGFITGLTWDPLLSDETNWRVAFVEVVGVVAGALLACIILLLGSKTGEIRRLHLLVGAALPMAIALLIIVPVVKLMVQGPAVAIVSTILSALSFALISAIAFIEICCLAHTFDADASRCGAATLLIASCCAALGMTLINVVGTGGRMLCFLLEAAFFTAIAISYALMAHTGSTQTTAENNVGGEVGTETDLAQRCGSLAQQKGLSPRETDVLLLLARGYGSTHIANELGISENTVRTHVRHIYEKLGVGGREALIALVDSL